MRAVRLFLGGDVMTGRGIDQILPQPCDPALHESYVRSSLDYVRLAEELNGSIARPVDPAYIWGAALEEWRRAKPDVRIANLETSITRSEEYEDKGINYRMSPENAACLTAAGIDCCVLANNHMLDWGRGGLLDTLASLRKLKIKAAGAGRNRDEAGTPAIMPVGGDDRVLVFSYGLSSSGVPRNWAAGRDAPGVNFLADLSEASIDRVCAQIARVRRAGDSVVVSLHWGSNWGYDILPEETRFARALIDRGGVSVIHGHSSHHFKAAELYRDGVILYGCGDFINDYEGIEGYEGYRGDLSLMFFADVAPKSGAVVGLEIVPLQIKHFRLNRPSDQDFDFVRQRLSRESQRFGVDVTVAAPGRLALKRLR